MLGKTEDTQIIQAESMRRFCVAVCKEVQLSPEHAELLTDTLDLRGVHSHGVTRLRSMISPLRSAAWCE